MSAQVVTDVVRAVSDLLGREPGARVLVAARRDDLPDDDRIKQVHDLPGSRGLLWPGGQRATHALVDVKLTAFRTEAERLLVSQQIERTGWALDTTPNNQSEHGLP